MTAKDDVLAVTPSRICKKLASGWYGIFKSKNQHKSYELSAKLQDYDYDLVSDRYQPIATGQTPMAAWRTAKGVLEKQEGKG